MKINKEIFKEYDIRGKYPKEINEKIVYKIGWAFVKFLKLRTEDKVVVGQDKRPSSKKLAQAFISSLLDSRINVIDIGKVTTPMLYFAVPFFNAKGGTMITASHISKNSSGLKLVKKKSEPIGDQEIQKIYELTSDVDEKNIRCRQKGWVKKVNTEKDYFKAVGKFKNNLPAKFDYDGDRLLIKNFRGDIIGGILADIIAKKGDVIVYDLRCTHAIHEYFKNKGIIVIPSRVGHYNIKKLMREKKAVFGMEMTGHYYFKEFHYCESPLYGLKKLNEYVNKTGKSLTELAKPFNKYFHSGVINIKLPRPPGLAKRSGAGKTYDSRLVEKYRNGAQNHLDGLTVEFSNWWFNIRPSHTEPILTLVIEAKTPQLLEQKKKEIFSLLKIK